MKLGSLLQDKRVLWGGAGLAVAAGLFALYRRSQGGAGGAGDDTEAPRSSSSGQLGGVFPNTDGTNSATWMSQYSESIQRQLAEYQATLQETIDALGQAPPPAGPVTPRTPVPRRTVMWTPPTPSTPAVPAPTGTRRRW